MLRIKRKIPHKSQLLVGLGLAWLKMYVGESSAPKEAGKGPGKLFIESTEQFTLMLIFSPLYDEI